MSGYKNCYYDKYKKCIWLKKDDELDFKEYPYKHWCYVPDTSGKSNIIDLYKNKVKKKYVTKDELHKLKNANVKLHESDLNEEVKFMHEMYDKETLEPDINKWRICLYDIEISVENDFPSPEKALFPINLITCLSSIDGQTYTWGLYEYTGSSDVIKNYKAFDDELALLKDWITWMAKQKMDILSGWNSVKFDLPYIINRIRRLRDERGIKVEIERGLSPLGKAPTTREIYDRQTEMITGVAYEIPGLYHLDAQDLYETQAKHDPLPSYSLNYVCMHELGEGKLELEGSFNTIWKDNWNQFAEYNVVDTIIMGKLLKKKMLFELIIEYAYDCIVTLDKIMQKCPTTEGYFLKFMHNNKNMVMPDKPKKPKDWWRDEKCYEKQLSDGTIEYQNCKYDDEKDWGKYLVVKEYLIDGKINQLRYSKFFGDTKTGKKSFDKMVEELNGEVHPFEPYGVKAGYCYDEPGQYLWCLSFDITSSYPHHIIQYNISPEVKVKYPTKEQFESGEVIETDVNCVGFTRTDDAIIPCVVAQVFKERKHYQALKNEALARGDKVMADVYDNRQEVKKKTINSMYGVCLAPGFHLYDVDCARCITRSARVTLRDWLSVYLDKYYVSKSFLKNMNEYMPVCVISICEEKYHFAKHELINVIRDGKEIQIEACTFNSVTDLLGVEYGV